jgi:transposase
MPKKYVVQLGDGDRCQLRSLLRRGSTPACALTHAHILLAADQGDSDEQIAKRFHVCVVTVCHVRRRFVQQGLHAALHRRAQPSRPEQRKLDGDGEAHLIALACGAPPEGRQGWTLRLLADRMVELKYAESLSHETVRTTLKKTS